MNINERTYDNNVYYLLIYIRNDKIYNGKKKWQKLKEQQTNIAQKGLKEKVGQTKRKINTNLQNLIIEVEEGKLIAWNPQAILILKTNENV